MISKPISGAREEGVGGFIKGAGKGFVGLLMRPASGVVDFTSGTVDVVRRLFKVLYYFSDRYYYASVVTVRKLLLLQDGYLFGRNTSLSTT